MVSKSIERAQTQVESQNFEIRKNVLKYDEVLNTQREVIYNWRSDILLRGRASELVRQWSEEVAEDVARTATVDSLDEEAIQEFSREFQMLFDVELTSDPDSTEDLVDEAVEVASKAYEGRREELGEQILAAIERRSVLMVIDNKWREHLAEMDYLRAGINLRAMGNRDPLVEYQNEAYDYFAELMDSVARDSVRYVYHARVVQPAQAQEPAQRQLVTAAAGEVGPRRAQPVRTGEKIGRNDPCHCGSGKKFKKCHGAN
jgi:preprotein translocase subunit SecA